MTTDPKTESIGKALGRAPSGLYVLTVAHGGKSTGMLASWVQQAGFDPPTITVAIGRQRYVGDWIAASGRFTLSQLPVGSKAVIKHFSKGFEPDAPAFEGVPLLGEVEAKGGPVLANSVAYLDAEVSGELNAGDHRVFAARVIAGGVFSPPAEPFVHVRGNGFHY